jgi:hypothetical protein
LNARMILYDTCIYENIMKLEWVHLNGLLYKSLPLTYDYTRIPVLLLGNGIYCAVRVVLKEIGMFIQDFSFSGRWL